MAAVFACQHIIQGENTVKHVKFVSRRPAHASTDIGIGQILTIVAQILSVLGTALSQKD